MSLKRSARAVQAALDAAGIETAVAQLPDSTRTAQQAAAAIGCTVGQIAKSIVFVVPDTERAVLVVASGVNRIDEALIASEVGAPVRMATPEEVRAATGYAIGGVPPCGHVTPVDILVDEDLVALGELWAAAGTPHAVFRITPRDLLALTQGRVVTVAKK